MARPRQGQDDGLTDLQRTGLELQRFRKTCQRLERGRRKGTVPWEPWSQAVEQRNALFATIARIPITTIEDIVARYEAVAMELIDDDLILDSAARRRVFALRRDLRALLRNQRAGEAVELKDGFHPNR